MARNLPPPEQLAWDNTPPTKKTPYIPIYRAVPGVTLILGVVSPDPIGVRVHNIDKRDTPCYGADCPWRTRGIHSRWVRKWYYCAWCPNRKRRVMAEVTEDAMRDHVNNIATRFAPVAGCSLWMKRLGMSPRSPVRIEFRPAGVEVVSLPDPWDLAEALHRVWNGDNKEDKEVTS